MSSWQRITFTLNFIKMNIDIISVVPDLLTSPFAHSIMKRAADKGLLQVNVINLREHTNNIYIHFYKI